MIGHQLLELLTGVLAATIGMMQQRIRALPRRQIAITRDVGHGIVLSSLRSS